MIEEWGNGIIAARKVPMIIGQTWSKNWTGRMHGLNFIHRKRCMDTTCMFILTGHCQCSSEISSRRTPILNRSKLADLLMHSWRLVILVGTLEWFGWVFSSHIFLFDTSTQQKLIATSLERKIHADKCESCLWSTTSVNASCLICYFMDVNGSLDLINKMANLPAEL